MSTPAFDEPRPDDKPIRVMVVDDSAIVRGLIAHWLEKEPGVEVVARHANGKTAAEDVGRSAPDLVLLDIEMPVMDGIEALPLMLKARPETRVLMVSTLTKRNAEISFKALSLGAVDYVPKPSTNLEVTLSTDFRDEVVRKVKALGRRRAARGQLAHRASLPPGTKLRRRRFSLVPPRAVAIGASTGGPEALGQVLEAMAGSLSQAPVLVAQHMPPMFTTVLAERLARITGREAREGRDGEALKPGTIYVAPGDKHMTVAGTDAPAIRLGGEPPVNFCRPAVDPLFRSVAASFGPASLGIVLTGMGNDGAEGARAIADAGGSIIAQDEESSVVWGMPGAAALSGVCAAVLSPSAIAETAAKLLRGERP